MKSLTVILSIFLLSSSKISFSQITFIKAYGDSNNTDVGIRTIQDQNGDYLILSRTGGNSDTDFYLIKTNNYGNLVWTKKYGGIFPEYSSSFQQTSDGGYILAGTRHENISQTIYNAYLIKTNVNGDTLWTKSYGGGSQLISSSY